MGFRLIGGAMALMGLTACGGARSDYPALMPTDQILSDVWAQEDQIRADTSTWLYSYLGLAYHPLTEAEMESYIAFWESPAGQRLNAALFQAFDTVFREVSLELGKAAGIAMQGRDI